MTRCLCSVAVLLVTAGPLAAGDVRPVSPGAPTEWIEVSDRCPTFNWTRAEGSEVELVVYRLTEESAEQATEPVLQVELPGSAHGWTPSLDRCLAPGERYAWSTRSKSEGVQQEWSNPFLFEIAQGPSTEDLREALATIRRHLAEDRDRGSIAPEEYSGRLLPPGAPSLPKVSPPRYGALRSQTIGASAGGGTGLEVNVETGYAITSYSDLGTALRAFGKIGLVAGGEDALGAGAVLFGTGGATGLVVSASACCDGNSPANHAAEIKNSSASGSGGDVLALTSNTTVPDGATNFISFFGGNSVIGQIQGDGIGGVEFDGTLTSPTADFAEFLPKLHESDAFEPGAVVGLLAGKLSYRTHGADRVMVVSTRPLVTGGRPDPEQESHFGKVAFLGRVPVRVRGRVTAGNLLIPSGKEDGTAVAVAAEDLRAEDSALVIGRALEDSAATSGEGPSTVSVLVGLTQPAFASEWRAVQLEMRLYRWLLAALSVAAIAWIAMRHSRFGSTGRARRTPANAA